MTEMNNRSEFSSPENMKYKEIVPPYQVAFKGEPWYEVSKCADEKVEMRCPGGLSSTAIGEICNRCGLMPLLPAYETGELTARFEELAVTRPTRWYTERVNGEVAMAAVAWIANSQVIAEEKYADVPIMNEWLEGRFGNSQFKFIWLDEVFANKTIRGSGNLQNFGDMCRGFSDELGKTIIAFRTINEAMVRAAKRDFKWRASVMRSDTKETSETGTRVPDRRDFVIINMTESEF